MGCGLSTNDVEVKSPNEQSQQQINIVISSQNGSKQEADKKNFDLKQIKTQKSILPPEHNSSVNAGNKGIKQQMQETKISNARIFLFGQSKEQRKIIQFQASPAPHIQILLSRTHNLPPVKYQPTEVILQQSQQLMSSNLYISNSHPPYNYMFATFVKYNTIFLCGGVNFGFDYVTNETFIFNVKDEQSGHNSPLKNDKSVLTPSKNKRRIGNNLMGAKFQRLGLMKTKRYSHMGTFYKAGKLSYVFVFGGRNQNDETLTKCEKYSLQQNKWSQIAPLNAPRSTGFAIIVNKKIYVFGGYTKQGKRSKKIQRYNPQFDNWEVLNIKLHKGIQTGLILPCPSPNEILIVGGNVEFGALKSVIKINFQNQTYIWDSDLKKQRLLQKGIALLEENTAYVLGGDFQDTVQKYSYKDKTWKIVNNLNYGQCVSPDQINSFTLAQETLELNYEADAANHATNKSVKQADTLSVEYKYVFGSDDYPCIYEINTTKWVLKKKNVPMSLRLRCFMTVAKIKQGKIFIAGGIDSYFEKPSKAAYIYYTGTNKAIQIAKIKQKKYAFAACAYNNCVYIFGGQDGKQGKVLSCAEKYDVTEDKWVALPDMPRERTFAKVALSPNNKIMIFAGTDSVYQSVYQIDIFDPATDTFSTFSPNFPLACEIKFIDFTGNVVVNKLKKKATSQQFQFLDDTSSKQNSAIKLQKQKEQESQLKLDSFIKQEAEVNQQAENKANISNISNVKLEDIEEHYMIVFGHNSYRKQDEAYILSMGINQKQHISFDEKPHKLYPYSLTFSVKHSIQPKIESMGQNIENGEHKNSRVQQTSYYFISNKGVFKWQESTKKMDSQIVINQMHMLQMPLQKFCII